MSEPALKETPLFAIHQKLGAKFAPFAGYNMPVQYAGIIAEHEAVRKAAGLFDVSHMGVAKIEGPEAFDFLNQTMTRDLSKTTPGKAAYSLLCLENGGTVDDLIIYRAGPESFYLVLNASNKEKDVAHIRAAAKGRKVEISTLFNDLALLALQGPAAERILSDAGFRIKGEAGLAPGRILPEPFHFFEATLGGIAVRMATTGYTGEAGGEIFVDARRAADLWNLLMKAGEPHGLKPVGLGARDTLRTEMGYSLYGHELLETINPIEAGLSWAVGFDKAGFTGQRALVDAKAAPRRKLVSLKNNSRQAPRAGMRVFDSAGLDVGEVTSGTFSPSLGFAIGMALVRQDSEAPYTIDIRGTQVPFEKTTRPFLKKAPKA